MLSSKNIIVTGSGGGLGLSFATDILAKGAKVCLLDHNESLLHETYQQLRMIYQDRVWMKVCDISDASNVESCINEIAVIFNGKIDGLVNNAALATNVGGMTLSDIPIELWQKVLNINVIGTWLVSKHCLPYLKQSANAKIVNIASDTALWGAPKLLSYVASKGAVIAMSKSMANELGEFNIAVNVVAPGLVKTPSTEYVPKTRHDLYEQHRAISRPQVPDDVTGVVSFLLSDSANFITGQTIPVNGGFIFV